MITEALFIGTGIGVVLGVLIIAVVVLAAIKGRK